MHEVVTALAYDFTRAIGHEVELSSQRSARCTRGSTRAKLAMADQRGYASIIS